MTSENPYNSWLKGILIVNTLISKHFKHGPDFCCSAYFLISSANFFTIFFKLSTTKILKLVFPNFCQRKTNKKQTLMVHKVSPGDIFANNYGCEHMKNQLTTPTQDKI